MPKKVKIVKTPGLLIEVPQERRKTFFVRPKTQLEYWAFKNRPRVFPQEPLIFTFGGKPVAQAVVVRVEAPGKGEGEYKDWHKVYWKPTTFKKFKVTAATKLYHGTKSKLKPGDILDGSRSGALDPHDDPTEAEQLETTNKVLEQNRPAGALPRSESVYMVDDPAKVDFAGGYEDYIYEVKPIGKVEKNDMDWYGELSTVFWDSADDPEANALAKGYWSGKPRKGRLWEYRAPKAEVVRLVSKKTAALLKGSAKKPVPKVLYHGTASENVPAILKRGLDPSKSRSSSEGVYLAGDAFTAENYENMYLDLGGDPKGWTILRVDVSKLDENLLEVDDDDFAKDIFFQLPERTQSYYGDDPYNVPWWKSVEYSGQCVYMGKIPPAAIAVVSSKEAAAFRLPTFEQVNDKGTDANNEFDMDVWRERNLGNMNEYYDEVAPKLAALKFPLTVYRCFALREGDKVDFKSLGGSWSLNSRAAYLTVHEMFDDEEYEQYPVVTGTIQSPNEVDWLNTVRAWMTLPEEQEIRLKGGAKVKVRGRVRTAGDRIIDVGEGDEYWAGEGNAASGILPVCPSKGTVCLAWRSEHVMTSDCWGTIGGAVQAGLSPSKSARAELAEETGYSGGITLHPAYVFTDRGFTYHNFVGVVGSEFGMSPKPYTDEQIAWLRKSKAPEYQFRPGWETDRIVWAQYAEVVKDMKEYPADYHPGLLKLFANSSDTIERALGAEKTASKVAWREIEHEYEPEGSYLFGGILESTADLDDWLSERDQPPMDSRRYRRLWNLLKGKKIAVIDDMKAETKGKGVGTKMVTDFFAEAQSNGCDAIILHAGIHEKQQKGFDLVAWYKSKGFKDLGKLGGMPLMIKWLKPQGKSADGPELLRSPYIPEDEWQRINKWLISLGWRGRNPWYPERFPWFAIRLFSDGWTARNELSKEEIATGEDLASLRQFLTGWAQEYGTNLGALRSGKTIDMQTEGLARRGAVSPTAPPPDASRLPCPSGKRKFFDEHSAIGPHRGPVGLKGVPFRAYRCPKCGWWHVTSQPARQPVMSSEKGYDEKVRENRAKEFGFWFEPGFPEDVKAAVLEGCEEGTEFCAREAKAWTDKLKSKSIDAKLVEGDYWNRRPLDEGVVEHWWVEVGGKIFDPTAFQFYAFPPERGKYKTGAQQHMFPNSQDARFRQWFDGSKVVDKKGNPMPVYHGTRSSVEFEEFSVEGPPYVEEEERTTSSGSGGDPTAYMGAHFAEEPAVANMFAEGKGWTSTRYEGEAEKPRVLKVFLRISNPKDFGSEFNLREYIYQGKIADDEVVQLAMQNDGILYWEEDEATQKAAEEWYAKYENDASFRSDQNLYLFEQHHREEGDEEALSTAAYDLAMQAKSRLRTAGHDGVRYKNQIEGGNAWIAFEPGQIKSAYAQQFDPNNPRFTASKRADGKRTFFHGTTWDAAKEIDREGIRAKGGWVYCTSLPGKAYEYGQSISWHELDKPDQSAVVEFEWDGEVETDPEHVRGDAGKHRTEGYFRIPADIPRADVKRIEWFGKGGVVKAAKAPEWPKLPPTEEWVKRARLFLNDKWAERHKELGREGDPDLAGACKFASLFAFKLFGGKMVGNPAHQVLRLPMGQLLDLASEVKVPLNFTHDKEFWMNPEHAESMASCEPRVAAWVDEFMNHYRNDVFVNRMNRTQPSRKESSEDAMYAHFDTQNEVAFSVIDEYRRHKGDKSYRMKWDVVPAGRLKKIWGDYMKLGFVRDEAGIDRIANIIYTNIAKIEVNNILSGHSEQNPEQYASDLFDEQFPEDYFNDDNAFFDDDNGSWRISDYAADKLGNGAIALRDAKSAEDKLQAIDYILSITHQRSDLSSWFVEGGRSTLNQIYGKGKSGPVEAEPMKRKHGPAKQTVRPEIPKAGAAHTPQFAQKLVRTLKQHIRNVDFKVVGSVGSGKTSENDIDILMTRRGLLEFDPERPWAETGLAGTMKLLGFDYLGDGGLSPDDAEAKGIDPDASIERFFNPTSMLTVEFWYDAGWDDEGGWTEKRADWKSKYLLPGALALGLGAPATHPGTATPQQVEQKREEQEARSKAEQDKKVDALIKAISRAEGADPLLNNPGNLVDFNTGKLRSFDSWEDGRDALEDQLQRIADGDHPYISPDMTLGEAGLIYSNGDPNWASNVSRIMHVPLTIKMGELIRGRQQVEAPPSSPDKTSVWLKKAAGFAFKSFKKLWHVGTMNPRDKRKDSYEGAGLSVSVDPEDWQQIAEIGGPLWELTKPGNRFVNYHRLSKAQRKQVADWGVRNGYAQATQLWRHSWFDTESGEDGEGEWRHSDYATKAEADRQLGTSDEEKVEPVKGGGLLATKKLSQKSKRGKIDPLEVMDLLVVAYAEDELDCDGVWWDDTYDPENLSAPRGVIFPAKLPSWTRTEVQSTEGNEVETEEDEAASDAEEIRLLERDIKKHGDPDGMLTSHLKMLKNKKSSKTSTAVQPFYHGTTWAAADKIATEGLKAHKWQYGPGSYVWASIIPEQGHSYGLTVSDEDDYAVVTFLWDYDETEPDPEHEEHPDVYRRIPSDVPRSAIQKIEYFDWNGDLKKTASRSENPQQ